MIQIYLNAIETSEQKSIFEIMYYEYKDIMFAKARSILSDTQLAEDAVHTAFLRVAESFEKIENKLISTNQRVLIISNKKIKDFCPNIGAYLIIVVRNVCFRILNEDKQKRTIYTDKDDFIGAQTSAISGDENIENLCCSNETIEAIADAIRQLGDTYRDALHLHIVLGMDASEIAEALNCSYENARKRIQRGRKKLQELLSND